jgi:hypothetical protein
MEILMSPFGARLRWPTAAVLQIRNLAARGANAHIGIGPPMAAVTERVAAQALWSD